MNNIIGILIVIAVLALAIIGIRRRSKKGGCCGGGGSPVPVREKKLEGRVLGKKVVTISGMHCEHCVNNVTNAINRIDGASASVSLARGEAVVSYDREVRDKSPGRWNRPDIAWKKYPGYEIVFNCRQLWWFRCNSAGGFLYRSNLLLPCRWRRTGSFPLRGRTLW